MKRAPLLAITLLLSLISACGGGDSAGFSNANTTSSQVYADKYIDAGDFYNEVNNGSLDLAQGDNRFKHPFPAPISTAMLTDLLLDLAAYSLQFFNMGQQPQRMLNAGLYPVADLQLAQGLFNAAAYGLHEDMFNVFSLSQVCQYDAQYNNQFYLASDYAGSSNRANSIRVQYKANQCVINDVYHLSNDNQLLIDGDINFDIQHNSNPTKVYVRGHWFVGDTLNNRSAAMHYRAYRNLDIYADYNTFGNYMQYTNLKADMYLRDNHFFYDHLYFVNSKNISAYYGADTPFAGSIEITNEESGKMTMQFNTDSFDIFVNGDKVLSDVPYQDVLGRDLHRRN